MFGLMVIGIRLADGISGTKVTGLGHPTQVPGGWRPVTMGSSSLRDTGKVIAAGLNMTIAGTGTLTGTVSDSARIVAMNIARAIATIATSKALISAHDS
jgi:hypothetical protein